MTDPETTGARLKAERERRKLSAQKAADQLHLDGWVIDALEADDYQRIGPSVYAKGHLKRYAGLLGLPEAEIMQGYESHGLLPKPAGAPADKAAGRIDTPPVGNLLPPQVIASIGVALLLIGGLLWWKPWHQRVQSAPARASTKAPNNAAAPGDFAASALPDRGTSASPAASPPPGATSPPVPSSPAVSPGPGLLTRTAAPGVAGGSVAGGSVSGAAVPAAAASDANPAAGAGRVRLRLSFSADSWVDIHDAAGHRAFAGKGRANSVRTIVGMAPMRVFLGYAGGVQLEINNRAVAIGSQFVAGDVARFEVGADGVLRRDPQSAPGAPPRAARPPG